MKGYLLFYPLKSLLQSEFHVVSEAVSLPGPRSTCSPAKSKNPFKNIAEIRKNIIETAETLKTATGQTFMAIPVIDFPLFIILEDLISFGGLFEFFFSFLIPLVPVRMMFKSLLSVSSLDLFLLTVPGNA